MASFKTTYLSNLLLNCLYGGAAFDSAIPATIYAIPYTAAPTVAGGGTEYTASGLSRASVTRNTTNFPTSSAATISNATAISFGTPATGATVVGIGWIDASSGGNLLSYGDLDVPKVVTGGVAFTMQIGSFVGTEA